MKRFFYPTVCVLTALTFANTARAQKPESVTGMPMRSTRASVSQDMTNRTLINVGQVAMWIHSDGLSARTPSGNSGMFFPRGNSPATAVMFQDQLVWGGQVMDGTEPLIRVGGGQYAVGHVPGRILSPGVAEDRTDPNVNRVWRIRRNFHNAQLTLDAAEFNDILPNQVTQAQIDQVRDIYRQDWLDWPADKGAPFYDADGDGSYNPVLNSDGSPRLAPRGDESFDPTRHADEPGLADADQVVWLVTNDLEPGTLANFSGSPSIGLEQQITLWAFARADEIGQVIFKRYRLIYKGDVNTPPTATVDSMHFAQWSDPDVGASGDDLAGCDVGLDLGFAYNSSSSDPVYSAVGLPPPAVGFDFLAGPAVPDAGGRGVFDLKERQGIRNLPMTSFAVFRPGDSTSDPGLGTYETTRQWWNLLHGYLPRPTAPRRPFIDPATGIPTKFMLSGDPILNTGWVDMGTGDRRMVLSTGPATLAFGDTQDVVVASIAAIGTDRLSSVSLLKFVDRLAQEEFDNLTQGQRQPPELSLRATGLDGKVVLEWTDIRTTVDNSRGEAFEGYNIYQGESPNGPWQRVITFDEVNNVEVIFDEVFDPVTGTVINMPVQFGRDSGIQHFVEIAEDVLESAGLVNGREYYFGVSAYVYRADAEPNALESAISAVAVTPAGPVIGTDYSDVAADTLAEHVSGDSDGTVRVTVIDPSQVTGHDYQISFSKDDNTDEILWSLVDLDLGHILLEDQSQIEDSLDISGSVADGMLVQVLGPPPGFKSFAAVANAAGLLDPPEGGAADFQGFPSSRPTERQQVGSGIWFFNVGGGANDGSFATFLSRSLRNDNFSRAIPFDWEMRFTSRGSWALRWFNDSYLVKVPFELWNVGSNTLDDPSDDYRCIPYFLGSAGLGYAGTDPLGLTYQLDPVDHGTSGGTNDPFTPWIYWIIPNENLEGAPGEGGYNTYISQIDTTIVGADANIGFNGGHEAFARTVLVSWNGDDVSDGEVAAGTQMFPEEGTIFRVITTKPNREDDIFRFSTEAFMMFNITKGDINDDGSVDVADVVLLIDFILQTVAPTGEQQYAADFNDDLGVNVADVVAIVNHILGISSDASEPLTTAEVGVNLSEQALVENGIVSVPLLLASQAPVHGLQVELEYDSSRLKPVEASAEVGVYQHAHDGKVTYVFNSFDNIPLALSTAPVFRFELIDAGEKSDEMKISLAEVVSADERGDLQKTAIGNSVSSTRFVPKQFALHQNFPNPFNPETTLRFDLPNGGKVDIEIYNVLGQRVRRLLSAQDFEAGQHSLKWHGRDDSGHQLASGVYVVRLRSAGFVKSRKLMLLK